MVDPVRQEVVATAHTVVVKVGTNVLTGPDGTLDRGRVQSLADGDEIALGTDPANPSSYP